MYLSWQQKNTTDFSDKNTTFLYDQGFLFTRVCKGDMYQTRSLRIDLSKFNLSSENRRILKQVENINLEIADIPYLEYTWKIHKLGKDFYTTKFGEKTFSAGKIKELITEPEHSNFNKLFIYKTKDDNKALGYVICFENKDLLHYCYPFYDLNTNLKSLGLGMMTKAIVWAKENNKKYIYLGSASRPTDTYKLQFEGLEWFDGKNWNADLDRLKQEIK
jgi:arginyl-tRNA--protein-N-Asp/Glu arginylyltransferase